MNITEKYKKDFINQYFENAEIDAKCVVEDLVNAYSFADMIGIAKDQKCFIFYNYQGTAFIIHTEQQLYTFLKNNYQGTEIQRKNALHFFEFGKFADE